MSHYLHYEKRLHPYKILGSERTPYQPSDQDIIVIRVITPQYDPTTRLHLRTDDTSMTYAFDQADTTDKGWSYQFSIGKLSYGTMCQYYFSDASSTSDQYTFTVSKTTPMIASNTLVSAAPDGFIITIQPDHDLICHCYARFDQESFIISQVSCDSICHHPIECSEGWQQTNLAGYTVAVNESGQFSISDPSERELLHDFTFQIVHTPKQVQQVIYDYASCCDGIYGTGERYNQVNQMGLITDNMIFEQFTNQDRATYFPLPFYFTPNGYGIYVNTRSVITYDFNTQSNDRYQMTIDVAENGCMDDMYLLFGDPQSIIGQYLSMSGQPQMPPDWSYGVWISANRWDRQSHIDEQIQMIQQHDYPATVLVIEAWSDERTFYIFNDAEYTSTDSSSPFQYEDFTYPIDGKWPDPQQMIHDLQDVGVHLVLWQIPVLKTISQYNDNPQHNADVQYAVDHKLCVQDRNTVYAIPDFWFDHSYLPDFTNPKANEWWFSKRQYLLDMGVKGFKTDGGEFIYKDDLQFHDNSTGRSMKNGYASEYIREYSDFVGSDGVLFSRASYLGNQRHPIHWAGDQLSTWNELRSVIKAGLSMGLSGVPYWSFDIGGFAGEMPTAELYIRSTQAAVFCPIMQWHSEPMSGQFEQIYPRDANIINDRSPWNIQAFTQDPQVLQLSIDYAHLRTHLLPHLLDLAHTAKQTGQPMMAHLIYGYANDPSVYAIEDQFMMGSILVAPILEEDQTQRDVYLPHGQWLDLNTGESIDGTQTIEADASIERIPLYLRSGCGIVLNLNDEYAFYEPSPKNWTDIKTLTVLIWGDQGTLDFNTGHEQLQLHWSTERFIIDQNTTGREIRVAYPGDFSAMKPVGETYFNDMKLNIY